MTQSYDCSGGVETEPGSLSDEPSVRAALHRMVLRMEGNPHTREDLLQQALVHLWCQEREHPGQRLSWYLQGVSFHLHHLRASGSSLDSPKHRGAQAAFAELSEAWDQWSERLHFDEGIMSEVNAHDIVLLLSARLKPREQSILGWLADGLGTSEIANLLHISHQAVNQDRRNIASVAIKIGIVPHHAHSIAPGKETLQNPGAASHLL